MDELDRILGMYPNGLVGWGEFMGQRSLLAHRNGWAAKKQVGLLTHYTCGPSLRNLVFNHDKILSFEYGACSLYSFASIAHRRERKKKEGYRFPSPHACIGHDT